MVNSSILAVMQLISYLFSFPLLLLVAEAKVVDSDVAYKHSLSMHILSKRGSHSPPTSGFRRRLGFKNREASYSRLSEAAQAGPSRQQGKKSRLRSIGLRQEGAQGISAGGPQARPDKSPEPRPGPSNRPPSLRRSHSSSSSSSLATIADSAKPQGLTRAQSLPRAQASSIHAPSSSSSQPGPSTNQEQPRKVSVASVEARKSSGKPFVAFSRTPTEKNDHIGTVFGDKPYVVHHDLKASAGGHNPAGAQLEATAQGKWTSVKLDLKQNSRGYITPFYNGVGGETKWYNAGRDGKVKKKFPPDPQGNRMGVVAGVIGEGYVKAKGSNQDWIPPPGPLAGPESPVSTPDSSPPQTPFSSPPQTPRSRPSPSNPNSPSQNPPRIRPEERPLIEL